MAMEACSAERRLTTMCEGAKGSCKESEAAASRDVAIREGIRNAKVIKGYGSIATEVKEDKVAP